MWCCIFLLISEKKLRLEEKLSLSTWKNIIGRSWVKVWSKDLRFNEFIEQPMRGVSLHDHFKWRPTRNYQSHWLNSEFEKTSIKWCSLVKKASVAFMMIEKIQKLRIFFTMHQEWIISVKSGWESYHYEIVVYLLSWNNNYDFFFFFAELWFIMY